MGPQGMSLLSAVAFFCRWRSGGRNRPPQPCHLCTGSQEGQRAIHTHGLVVSARQLSQAAASVCEAWPAVGAGLSVGVRGSHLSCAAVGFLGL